MSRDCLRRGGIGLKVFTEKIQRALSPAQSRPTETQQAPLELCLYNPKSDLRGLYTNVCAQCAHTHSE